VSLLFLSSGAVSYVSTTTNHHLFQLTQLKGLLLDKTNLQKNIQRYYPLSVFANIFFIIAKLPKNKPVCLVETTPTKGVQYVRSTGSSASILKMDSRIGTALIKLPSGMKKVFSTYSMGSLGSVALPENKKFTNASAGYYRRQGIKSQVRGVAMNPVDHPHGGRTKAIKYQRTP
jgi:ribosomal protein L2